MSDDFDYESIWVAASATAHRLHSELQDKNGVINRLKHELQSIEYALSDERINNTMTASDVAHEMRCELDTLRAELDALTLRLLAAANYIDALGGNSKGFRIAAPKPGERDDPR